MITYENVINVRLDGKTIGTIKEVDGGYQYYPKGHGKSWAGDVYPTIKEVKDSLEEN